jgi:hypothetical protein
MQRRERREKGTKKKETLIERRETLRDETERGEE